jgi:hypothetical protein
MTNMCFVKMFKQFRHIKIKNYCSRALVVYTCNLATQEAEMRRIVAQSQSGQIVPKYLS